MTPKEQILAETECLVSEILYYNRKNCEGCTRNQLDELLRSGELTPKEIVEAFALEMRAVFPEHF